MIDYVWKIRYQQFAAVSGIFGAELQAIDDVLSSHEHAVYPSTSLDKNCLEFVFRKDWIFYVHLRQTLALKLELIQGRSYENYNARDCKWEQKVESKQDAADYRADGETAKDPPVPPVTHLNKIL